ncbi:MAG: MoaD/ThiS family protein [Hadesarchaea archaeon]|nr:MoaD/ThiS family protein [Hadesarchaea archaeon]
MEIRVRIQGELKDKAGTESIRTPIQDRETIDTLFIKLSRRAPDLVETVLDPRTGGLSEDFDVLLNGRSIQELSGLHTRLKDKDEVSITPAESKD